MIAELNDTFVQMEVDTGASRSIISRFNYKSIWSETKQPKLLPPTQQFNVWVGKQLSILGEITVKTKLFGDSTKNSPTKTANLVVVEGQGPILFSRDNLSNFNLPLVSFSEINANGSNNFTTCLDGEFPDLFAEGLGCYSDYKVSFDTNPHATPKFCKARSVSYAMKPVLIRP